MRLVERIEQAGVSYLEGATDEFTRVKTAFSWTPAALNRM